MIISCGHFQGHHRDVSHQWCKAATSQSHCAWSESQLPYAAIIRPADNAIGTKTLCYLFQKCQSANEGVRLLTLTCWADMSLRGLTFGILLSRFFFSRLTYVRLNSPPPPVQKSECSSAQAGPIPRLGMSLGLHSRLPAGQFKTQCHNYALKAIIDIQNNCQNKNLQL